jgi:fucose 4-O-acetylase-like acetyltransferase
MIVVFGHSVQVNHPNQDGSFFYWTLYPFAMPLFMLLSGFIISSQLHNTLWGYLKKYTLRLIVPFFVWAVVSYGFYRLYNDPRMPASIFDVSFPVYLWSVVKSPSYGLWFLWVLFFNSVLLFSVLKLVQVRNWLRWENYFVIATILLSRAASADLFGLSELKIYYTYYVAGFFACKYYDVLKANRKIFYAVALIGYPLLVWGYRRNEFPTFYPFLIQIFGDTGLARLMGMALVSFLLECVRRTQLYFFCCWVGMLTLDIYVCHAYFLKIGFGGTWQYLYATVITFICSIALTLFILRRFKITRLIFLGQSR